MNLENTMILENAYPCTQCNRRLSTASGLKIHVGRMHKVINIPHQADQFELQADQVERHQEAAINNPHNELHPSENTIPPDGTGEIIPVLLPENFSNLNVIGEVVGARHVFIWGNVSASVFSKNLETVYNKIVYWKKNLFKLPSGSAGKDFVRETTRLIKSWTSKSALRDIAWKCVMTMPQLLLQKPAKTSKSKDHVEALKRRLILWKNGDILELLRECKTIQARIKSTTPSKSTEATSKKFATLMKQGNISAAVKLLTSNMSAGILPLNEETMKLLHEKHPDAEECSLDAIVEEQMPDVHPVVFEAIDEEAVREAAMRTRGGAGPSGMDADSCRHLLVSRNFGNCAVELRTEFAKMIRLICIEKVEVISSGVSTSSSLEAFLACRLLPLDKNPGLRPIGVGEVLRRIAGKVVMKIVKTDVQDAAGSLQVCAGQPGGCESAIHAMRTIYEDDDTDAVLLIDAANAFNSMNRGAMLANIQRLCPIIYIYAYNCYAVNARLFVVGGKELASREGTTQGDPPSMVYYAIGLLPYMQELIKPTQPIATEQIATVQIAAEQIAPPKHAAYADDLTGGGKIANLRSWFNRIVEHGPKYGYSAEPTKSWLIVKEQLFIEATNAFEGTGVKITTHGKKHLGAAIGQLEFKSEFVSQLVKNWADEIISLAKIAEFEPQAAYAAFTNCIRHKYTFYMRTIPAITELLLPLEHAIRHKLIPALIDGRLCSNDERCLLALPVRLGGMGLVNPTAISDQEHENSKLATEELTRAIINQQRDLPENLHANSKATHSSIRSQRRKLQSDILNDLRSRMSDDEKRANLTACAAASSNWLTTLPLDEKGYALSKQEFWDAVNIRYNWTLTRLPTTCACGERYNMYHAFTCKKGGFVINRHNDLRDLTASLLDEVCTDVCVEPPLAPLTGESFHYLTANRSDEARLDISARGVWCKGQRAFFDIRVFNLSAQSYQGHSLEKACRKNEMDKKREYNERVLQTENGTFTPLVFSATGGMGIEGAAFYKQLCALLSKKRNEPLAAVTSWVNTKLSFALLRSAILCIRGTRSRYYKSNIAESDTEIDMQEATIRAL